MTAGQKSSQADTAGSQYNLRLGRGDIPETGGMDSYGKRLNQGPLQKRNLFRQPIGQRGRMGDIAGQYAVMGRRREKDKVTAEIIAALPAEIAVTARNTRLNSYFIARL